MGYHRCSGSVSAGRDRNQGHRTLALKGVSRDCVAPLKHNLARHCDFL